MSNAANVNVCWYVMVKWYPFLTNEKGRKTLNLLAFSSVDSIACNSCVTWAT